MSFLKPGGVSIRSSGRKANFFSSPPWVRAMRRIVRKSWRGCCRWTAAQRKGRGILCCNAASAFLAQFFLPACFEFFWSDVASKKITKTKCCFFSMKFHLVFGTEFHLFFEHIKSDLWRWGQWGRFQGICLYHGRLSSLAWHEAGETAGRHQFGPLTNTSGGPKNSVWPTILLKHVETNKIMETSLDPCGSDRSLKLVPQFSMTLISLSGFWWDLVFLHLHVCQKLLSSSISQEVFRLLNCCSCYHCSHCCYFRWLLLVIRWLLLAT